MSNDAAYDPNMVVLLSVIILRTRVRLEDKVLKDGVQRLERAAALFYHKMTNVDNLKAFFEMPQYADVLDKLGERFTNH